MEKFYIVSPEAKIHAYYQEYDVFVKKACEVFKDFANEHGIETSVFHPSVERLMIVPTDNDRQKFGKSFLKTGDRLCTFSLRSPITKAWVSACREAGLDRTLVRPIYVLGTEFGVGKFSARLFQEANVLYCTMQADTPFTAPDGFQEISGSEFYRRMEELGCANEL